MYCTLSVRHQIHNAQWVEAVLRLADLHGLFELLFLLWQLFIIQEGISLFEGVVLEGGDGVIKARVSGPPVINRPPF